MRFPDFQVPILTRFLYTVKQAWLNRSKLKEIRVQSEAQIPHLTDLDCRQLKLDGIQVLVFDFDGVMAPHGAFEPISEVESWLKKSAELFDQDSIFILSNKPLRVRERYFSQYFPGIRFIQGVRKKPYPDGLQKISQLTGVPCSKIALVDDRLLTGILACQLCGARGIYLTHPLRDFSLHPCPELFFTGMRWLERHLF
ncbi:MAG: HAD family hydrolase [Gammaproteobacteria bacterium]|nr:HAD family hydrolase [Gammaproteobacteria bacterium]